MRDNLYPAKDGSRIEQYRNLLLQAESIIDSKCMWTANYSNICALIQSTFNHWWCGFYFVNRNNQLELGVFQGPVACTLIEYGKGVCGTAWARKESVVVGNVHEFEGHIACSSESNSEIVVPVMRNNQVVAVLDIDSRNFNQFDEVDREYLEKLAEILSQISVNF